MDMYAIAVQHGTIHKVPNLLKGDPTYPPLTARAVHADYILLPAYLLLLLQPPASSVSSY